MESSNASLRFGRRELLVSFIGIILYGGVAWLSNFSGLAGALGVDIRPAVAIPIALGFIYGPIVGFISGMFGNLLGDFLQGYIILGGYPPDGATGNVLRDVLAAYYIHWHIGNGLSGMIPGIMALYHRRYRTFGDLVQVVLYIVAAAFIGMLYPVLIDLWVFPDYPLSESFYIVFLPVFYHNMLVSILLVPLLLYNLQRIDLRSIDWVRSGLLRQLLLAVFLAALIPTLLLGFFLVRGEGTAVASSGVLVQLGVTILLTLFYTTANAMGLAQTFSRPLLRLTEAARQMQHGQLTSASAQDLRDTVGDDEMAQLSRLFGTMAQEVIEREARLKQQLEVLKIEIDQVKQSKQVAEITDNEFFRDLQTKARTLRSRDRNPGAAIDSSQSEGASRDMPGTTAATP
jgi:hypothetical protein